MVAVLLFALALLATTLLSERMERTALSGTVLFLAVGFLAGDGALGVLHVDAVDPVVKSLAELALFSTLFSDGMRNGIDEVRRSWRLPGRALLLGLPLTLGAIAIFARWLTGLDWRAAILLGAVLTPTDPVFAEAILSQKALPQRLRQLLSVESGVNDGLALPIVLILLASYSPEIRYLAILQPVVLGIVIGITVAYAGVRLDRSPLLHARGRYKPLMALAIGLLVLSLSRLLHANDFLAAFAAGVTAASMRTDLPDEFRALGGHIAELLKFAGLLIFGALLSPASLFGMPATHYLFLLLVLVVARPVGLSLGLLGERLSNHEWVTAAWFGPKGFASVVYAILVLESGIPDASRLFSLAALVIAGSIVLHSSTAVHIGRWVGREEAADADEARRSSTADGRNELDDAREHIRRGEPDQNEREHQPGDHHDAAGSAMLQQAHEEEGDEQPFQHRDPERHRRL